MAKIELHESLFPRNDSMNSVSLLFWCKTREGDIHFLLSCLLGVFKIQDILGDFGCRNQCYVSVLQRVVSLRA